jgi:hypothetical protein
MTFDTLYVIVYWMEWVGTSCVGNAIYPNKEDAEKEIEELKKLPSYRDEKYKALTLSEYISTEREEAANEVRFPMG